MGVVSGLFVPGLAVRGRLYWPGLPADWLALDPPGAGRARGRFDAYREWLSGELVARGRPVTLAGHSMGAAVGICAASERPDLVKRLILFSPAGLPLSKPLRSSFWLLQRQVFQGLYPAREVRFIVGRTVRYPWATYRLAREIHDLDLSKEMRRVVSAQIPALVVGCASDTLTTPAICNAVADRLAGEFEQVEGGGHMWMLTDWVTFRRILSD
jgi:pimeloyl-ACP methyl ester carboxylesterase